MFPRHRPIILVLVALSLSVLGLGVAVLLSQTRLSETARVNHRLASQATVLAEQIQQQRYEVLLRNCQDSNQRHDATVATLRREIDAHERDPRFARQKTEIEASFRQTVLLINALSPRHSDCATRAKKATS